MSTTNDYMRVYMQKRYYLRIEEAKLRLGGKCNKCGSKDNLQFDHIDPSTKSFAIAKYIASCFEKKFEEEIIKCQLLCEECHKKKTRRDLGWMNGRKTYKLICAYCKTEITRTYRQIGPKLKAGQKDFYCNRTCMAKHFGRSRSKSTVGL